MKSKIKIFSIITLAVIISFMTTGCKNLDKDDTEPTITSVTVSPETASVAKGGTQSFTATIIGTNNPAQTVTWTIVQTNKNAGTNISTSGVLTVAAAETLTSLTVKATSTVDNGKSGTATVTVTGGNSNTLTGTVSITGTAQVGQILTANTTNLGGSGTIGYQWKQGDTSSAAGTNIPSAISSTYTLVTADVGKYIKVTVTRSGYTGSIDSAATGAVLVATAPIPTVTNVTVSPATASVAKGATQNFTATVTGTNSPAQTVTWSIVETGKKTGTTINTSGRLTVAADETITTLTVRATSTADTTKSGTAAVTVTVPPSYNGVTWTNADLSGSPSWQKTVKNDGYDVEMWNENKQGTASMTLGSGGAYKCSWSGINNVLFRAGKKYNETQTHTQIGTISIEYKADKFELPGASGTKNAYLSCYGWISNGAGSDTTNLVEYYIIDNYGEYNPGTNKDAISKGSATIDGATYNFYEIPMNNRPSIKGNTNFTQYLSIRASKRMEGTISVSEHFKAWNDKGMTKVNGKMYEVAFKVESYGGTAGNAQGNAEISKNILKINGTPIN